MGEGHGIAYMQIFNDQQELLSVMGKPIHGLINKDFDRQEILKGKKRILSRKVETRDSKILDMAAPFILDKKIVGHCPDRP